MAINKETKTLQMSWGRVSEFAQAVKVGDTIYLVGQVSHDPESDFGRFGEMEIQMRQVYGNVAKLLKEFGASLENIVDVVLFVRDMEAAESVWVKCRQDVFGRFPALACSVLQIERRAFPELLIEIKCVAKV
ncbi:MAG TPA: RidA family protein [Pyrinomonadaceae bacterium]|jgi:enamine deaminase RidA (YjgF/YER057c/UK114 family)